jgi:hypothetical protein
MIKGCRRITWGGEGSCVDGRWVRSDGRAGRESVYVMPVECVAAHAFLMSSIGRYSSW